VPIDSYPHVKVIATLGPSSGDPGTIYNMMGEGAWGFRVNMSHGDPGQWERLVSAVGEAEERHGWRPALIADLEGPRVRIVRGQEPVRVSPGDRVVFCADGEGCIRVTAVELFQVLREGDTVIVGDGDAVFHVVRVEESRAVLLAVEPGVVRPGKGVVVRGKDVPLPPLTDKDKRALDFAARHPFSHVMMSYVRNREHVEALRRALRERGLDHLRVLAKIESPGAVERVDEIGGASDGLVVARGDLGMHFPLEELPVVQARIARAASRLHKPLIVATEILASMVENPHPTRSEITDIFEAVRLGADALLLTAETAIGRYPVKAVAWARRAASRAVEHVEPPRPEPRDPPERLANGLVELAESLNANILVYTRSGRLPARIAGFKPRVPVYVGAGTPRVERVLRILWGLAPVTVGEYSYQEGLEKARRELEPVLAGRLTVEASWSREEGVYQIKVRNIRY